MSVKIWSPLGSCVLLPVLTLACASGIADEGESTFGGSFDSVSDDDNEGEADTDGDTDTTDSTGDGDGDGDGDGTGDGDGDGDGDTSDTDSTDAPDECGNAVVDADEECDSGDLDGNTCLSLGFDGGTLSCAADCTLDTSLCETVEEFCGDAIINNGEECEAGMLGNGDCVSVGFVFGDLACDGATCMYDTSGCQNSWFEDFEAGVVPAGWTSGGNANWGITSNDKYAGNYAGKAGAIGHSQNSWAQVVVEYPIAGSVSFWHKISSESGYDYGRFTIDGGEQGAWSGAGGWVQFSGNVAAGQHTFRWTYSKDASVVSGADTWYVDDVTFTGGYVP